MFSGIHVAQSKKYITMDDDMVINTKTLCGLMSLGWKLLKYVENGFKTRFGSKKSF